MLNNAGGMGNNTGHQQLAFGQIDMFPQVILMLMPRVPGLERIGRGVHLQHFVHHHRKVGLVDSRALIDAIASVVSNPFLRDPPDRVVDGLDEQVRLFEPLLFVERLVHVNIRQEGIIDLQQKTGINDRVVFFGQRIGDGIHVFFLAGVVFVEPDAGDSGAGHERLFNSVLRAGRAQVGQIHLQCMMTDIAHRSDTADRMRGRDCAAQMGAREIVVVILGKCGLFFGIIAGVVAGALLKAGQTFLDVDRVAGL